MARPMISTFSKAPRQRRTDRSRCNEDDITMIAETFRSEREGVLSDLRGQSRGRFLSDVLHWMAQAGLNDTALNRDAAAEATFRARANGLFASAEKTVPEQRWPTTICLVHGGALPVKARHTPIRAGQSGGSWDSEGYPLLSRKRRRR